MKETKRARKYPSKYSSNINTDIHLYSKSKNPENKRKKEIINSSTYKVYQNKFCN